jgi:two-component system, OmpR family, response regulator
MFSEGHPGPEDGALNSAGVKLLVIEDDPKLARLLTRVLQEEGYVVDGCSKGEPGLRQATSGLYDLIVLDWMLPDLDGLSLCRRLRELGTSLPILMLTSRSELSERVMALDAGADDYVMKPFEIEELVARIRALLRRVAGVGKSNVGMLSIDNRQRRASLGATPLDLTSREYALLSYLMRRADQVVTRSELLAHVWSTRFDPGSNLVEVHVSRLRDKLGRSAWMIETVRGAGYRLRTARED